MDFSQIRLLLGLLQEAGIPVCIIGEFALNYNNAPRVVHDLELCVPADDLGAAKSVFESQEGLLEIEDKTKYNLYTQYKKGFPRFRSYSKPRFYVVIFTDKHYHLDPLQKCVIYQKEHQHTREYSRELLDSFSPDEIATLPFPRFTPLFRGFCRSYIETQEATAAMAAECLVDGMNINEEWCHAHFDPPESAESGFALRLVNSRGSRIDDFSLNQVTCFIPDLQEAQRLQRIPGFYE
ncbi:hypothetical protein, variant 3 [Blastomyces dermatitidis ER-3]|uniref:Uncharacterized protein n=1 Tax=Ajellomyces dermatitidis (strain ER-3 / ATCC MYA-2586) TaxID=559297 RepID=A0ABX2W0J8_AJEDR|nr:hypothetical protein, variant 1 [Blastomyces dermatitidis ER-3]XP_045282635.1 uncharacterized protein BDCG_08665 [Blastomyces dermatitidis ER-3]XP_045282636.1 hypothetical protein, variant 2 [Blastomyces dermatitidis ER-3]XP_045282637.1 hypothetical protein, variant 3 [Blastomyces dermatitidis ER-3]EEQ85396.1 hypothetical protein, variant 1 [Blastomyces dermatitidis ER-3]OAT02908.1 hypothetical protein BDCG_08665 [Blastomyces dermatitidis ER-3]OAT02909.1 hypothetical protein, variant 2 [Bl